MSIPSKVIYQGKTCEVIGYVGTKYRLAGIGNVLMSHCAKYVEPIEDITTVRGQPKVIEDTQAEDGIVAFIDTTKTITAEAQKAVDIVKAMTKPKGGRPRKNAKG